MNRRGKIIAISTAALGGMVLLAAGYAAKDRIRESWYVYEFDYGGEEQKLRASERLGALGSAHGVSWLFAEMRKEFASVTSPGWYLHGQPRPDLEGRARRLQDSLVKIGKTAIPVLIVALRSDEAMASYLSEETLWRMQNESKSVEVREATIDALSLIVSRPRELIDLNWPQVNRDIDGEGAADR